MTDRIVQDGVVRAVNDQERQVAALEGLGLSGDLAASEAASWRRYVPGGRIPWREVIAYEKEIARLEKRRREVEAKRLELGDHLRGGSRLPTAVNRRASVRATA